MPEGGESVDVSEPVETVVAAGDRRVHRFQVVRERRPDGATHEWVVVGIGDDDLRLATPDFEWTKTVSLDAIRTGRLEPLVAGGVPVWGY